jgi:hypothetical protein
MTDDECEFCDLAVAVGTSLSICKKIGNKKICKELENKIVNEEITPTEFFKTIRKMARGHKDELEIMDVVDKFLKESKHGKSKSKKTRKAR